MFVLLCFSLLASAIRVPEGAPPGPRDLSDHSPFISWVTFQNRCSDFILDEHTKWFDPDEVKRGDVIFLNFFFLQWFVDHVHDKIKEPYILITCDKGGWAPHPDVKKILYDPKLAAWFCRNMVFSYHPKLFQIPMGQDLMLFNGEFSELREAVGKGAKEKKHLLYMNHLPREHGDRDKLIGMFEHLPYCLSAFRSDRSWEARPRPIYYEEMAASKFVISPLGYETDCVRTWEAFSLGCIPIVEHTFLDPLFEGLPIVMVHDWEEVDREFLQRKYAELRGCSIEKASFDYWERVIAGVKEEVRGGTFEGASLCATEFDPLDLSDFSFCIGKGRRLIYKGFLSTMRPYQIAKHFPELKIELHDSWMDLNLERFLQDPLEISQFLKCAKRVEVGKGFDGDRVFLDLTYYRASLFHEDFWHSVISERRFRHSLKKDLEELFGLMDRGAMLFGNMRRDGYVAKVLERFVEENGLELGKKGDFWFILKI